MERSGDTVLFSTFGKRRTLVVFLFLLLIATLVLRNFPAIDLFVSAIFGNEHGFPLAGDAFLRSLRRLSINLTKGLLVFLILLWVYRLFFPTQDENISFAKLGFSSLSLVLGPAFVTNVILKDNWGRPRPRAIDFFGGGDPFVLPWTMSDYCEANCSFVSGETSSAIWLITLLPFVPAAFRRKALVIIVFYTLIISFLRIAFGGHFLSDVVLSILINLIVFWFVWGVFFRRGEGMMARDWALEIHAAPRFQKISRRFKVIFCAILCRFTLAYSALMNKVRQKD